MEDIKSKLFNFIQKQKKDIKIPAMGYTDYCLKSITDESETGEVEGNEKQINEVDTRLSDEEILKQIDNVYYKEDFDPVTHELKQLSQESVTCDNIEIYMTTLQKQQKVISKKVLQNIIQQKSLCCAEVDKIHDTETELHEALKICKKSRSSLTFAKKNLTSSSLEILAAYRKRYILIKLLESVNIIKTMKSTDLEVQKLLADEDFSGAIGLLLDCKEFSSKYNEYECVNELNKKVQETLLLTECQLDKVLNEMTQKIDIKKYEKLQEAYKLLNKSLIVMDQIHINFISTIHSTVNNLLRNYCNKSNDDKQKLLFEQLCENVPLEKYIPCLIDLCKSFWTILSSYYQIVIWHQNYKLFQNDSTNESPDLYIQEKLKMGQFRIWNDIQSKICTYLSTTKLKRFKYEQFIQILSIVQILKKIGVEFCGVTSTKLIETMQNQSIEFFQRYHITCLEEICLFLDNESWESVASFTNILQLQEFRSLKISFKKLKINNETKIAVLSQENDRSINANDEILSVNSQDGSSIYGSYGYFLRFSEKSSPFDAGLDASMLEEDILSGIVEESLYEFSTESDEDDALTKKSLEGSKTIPLFVNNTSLNVLRCIGRYLQMCKLLHIISPRIVSSIWELVEFYAYAVHEIFAKDAVVDTNNCYSKKYELALASIGTNIIPKINMWPLNFSSLTNNELSNSETLYGLPYRILAVESGICIVKQIKQLSPYIEYLLPATEKNLLDFSDNYVEIFQEMSKPVYICSTSRVMDLKGILISMSKVKWDVNHVSVQHSSYIDTINRNVQTFAMLLEEISKNISVPFAIVWDSFAHVLTHLLVEGFSNAKKCSAAGRALMQLDLTHFMSLFEMISGQKFPSHRLYVDSYVKAYYFPSDLFTEWIIGQKDCKTYSEKQLVSLISCVFSNDRRSKQRLLELIEINCDNA